MNIGILKYAEYSERIKTVKMCKTVKFTTAAILVGVDGTYVKVKVLPATILDEERQFCLSVVGDGL